ncbi:MAG: GntR family transcriptional regulator [Sulfitobacter sp.]
MNVNLGPVQETWASKALRDLKSALSESRWKPGEKLPTERELVDMLGVKRMSLRQALLALENEGSIFRIDRRGWYISQPRFIYDPQQHVSFQQAAAGQGTANWFDTNKEYIAATGEDAVRFGIAEGARILRVQGWGAFNGHRIFVHDVQINCALAKDYGEKLEDRSFTAVWTEDFGIEPKLTDLMIRPVRLEGEAQQMLGCTSGAPGLYIRRVKSDAEGRAIQIDREFWRFEALEIRFSL